MKKNLQKILSKPKAFVSVFTLLTVVIAGFLYINLGKTPNIPASLTLPSDTNQSPIYGSNISLSFGKTGRVESVFVKEGDLVKKGNLLAQLSAPDALGAVNQAKGALDLAMAQYSSMKSEYTTTKAQQDILVANAYKTLISSGLEAAPDRQDPNIPVISGLYSCGKEGSYSLKPYASHDNDSGYSINYSGLEEGVMSVKYDNPVPLGNCGLEIKFTQATSFNPLTVWTISIPNTKSSAYLTNKNAYDLVVNNRDKILSDLIEKISDTGDSGVAKAEVNAARGAYEAALGAYKNNTIIAPADGVVTFVDPKLKVGQSVVAGESVISISQQ